jgi:hypothetical protein
VVFATSWIWAKALSLKLKMILARLQKEVHDVPALRHFLKCAAAGVALSAATTPICADETVQKIVDRTSQF